MKSYRTIFAALFATAISVSAHAAPVTTKGGYEFDKNMLSDPAALNWNIEHCSHYGIAPDAREKLAKLLNVPPTNVRYEYCRRILTAYAKGAIPYDDYVQFTQRHIMSAAIAKTLHVSGSRSAAARPLRHKSASSQ